MTQLLKNDVAIRLSAIENPKELLLKVVFWYSKIQFGKVIAPLKYIYARSIPITKASFKLINVDKKLSLSSKTIHFIRYYTSHLNDCPFCSNVQEYTATKANMKLQEWVEFMNFRNSSKFSAKEKALLAYLEEVNLTKSATDETFIFLKTHFSEKEIVEITWVNASENYLNLMAKPLGLTSDELVFKKKK